MRLRFDCNCPVCVWLHGDFYIMYTVYTSSDRHEFFQSPPLWSIPIAIIINDVGRRRQRR